MMCWTLATTSPPSQPGGQIQPSHRALHGTAWHLQAIMAPGKPFAPAPRLHPPGALPRALLNVTQTGERWDAVTSHTGSPVSTANPHRLPGRCPPGARLPLIPGSSLLCSWTAQLVRDAGMMEYPARAEEARQNLSIHQGPHFLPSALGDN